MALGVGPMELWWSSGIVVSVVWRLPFETLLSIPGGVLQGANTPGLLGLCFLPFWEQLS
ncbi:hypothetical protein E4U51_000555 [Claviceps purpurea]|nr:hypothetical protein E4U51_000555 [Claviceps purpurea]